MAATFDKDTERCTLCLRGSIDISSAAELKEFLTQALACGKQICIDPEPSVTLDVTAYQLLYAASREAQRSGLSFKLVKQLPEEIAAAMNEVGLVNVLDFTTVEEPSEVR